MLSITIIIATIVMIQAGKGAIPVKAMVKKDAIDVMVAENIDASIAMARVVIMAIVAIHAADLEYSHATIVGATVEKDVMDVAVMENIDVPIAMARVVIVAIVAIHAMDLEYSHATIVAAMVKKNAVNVVGMENTDVHIVIVTIIMIMIMMIKVWKYLNLVKGNYIRSILKKYIFKILLLFYRSWGNNLHVNCCHFLNRYDLDDHDLDDHGDRVYLYHADGPDAVRQYHGRDRDVDGDDNLL
jgi:hypothetical protein